MNRYPQEVALRDGRRVLLRPFESTDTQALYEFFQRLPAELRRFAWDRLDDRDLIESWGRNIDFAKVFPLLAFDGERHIVADATIHRRKGSPLRLVGRVRWMVDPKYRGIGLGTTLITHLINHARENGLRHLSCMLIKDLEDGAVSTLSGLGFKSHVVPGYGTDPEGRQHDMLFMTLPIEPHPAPSSRRLISSQ